MDFALPPAHLELQARARSFADRVLRPTIGSLDVERTFPAEHVVALARDGFLAVHWPAAHGGAGLDTLAYAVVLEELARVSPAHAILVSVHATLVGVPLLQFGTAAQKEEWLPALTSGKRLGAFGLTEPEAGSDAGNVRTRRSRAKSSSSWTTGWRRAQRCERRWRRCGNRIPPGSSSLFPWLQRMRANF